MKVVVTLTKNEYSRLFFALTMARASTKDMQDYVDMVAKSIRDNAVWERK